MNNILCKVSLYDISRTRARIYLVLYMQIFLLRLYAYYVLLHSAPDAMQAVGARQILPRGHDVGVA